MNKREVFSNYQNKIFTEINDPFFLKTEELYERFLQCLPPEESYLFFPKGEEIMIPHKKPEKALRRIYTNVEFTQKEKEWLSEFKKVIAEKANLSDANKFNIFLEKTGFIDNNSSSLKLQFSE